MSTIAETNDQMAHALSMPYPTNNSLSMLAGARFSFDANQRYTMPADEWNKVKDDPNVMQEVVRWFVEDFYQNQLRRIITLERYYQGDNDIKFWHSNKSSARSDNRIASGLPRYITNIRLGYQFGNPIKFGYGNKADDTDNGTMILDAIEEFNSQTDEHYHEKVMGKNVLNTGRAYELLYIKEGTNQPSMKSIDPANCFIVYDNSIEQHSLFAVRFYLTKYMGQSDYYVDVYTDTSIFHFKSADSPSGEYELLGIEEHYFGAVPVTEFILNDERLGAWEPKLDEIDAYDKSLSEMANSQEDFSNSILVISGDVDMGDDEPEPLLDNEGKPVVDKHGNAISVVRKVDPSDRMMFLKPSVINNSAGGVTVVPTTAQYLTKDLNAADWKITNDRYLADIHRDTNTPDMSDPNFAGDGTGIFMAYKMWGSDQERATQEALYTRGLMRRLRLLANYWYMTAKVSERESVENIKITFTPNLPKNNAETVANMNTLAATGDFSSETIRDMGSQITGVPAEQEEERVEDERKQQAQDNMDLLADNAMLTDQQNGGVDDADDSRDTGTDKPINQAR